ncbi:dephospho-CoA kinase [Pseudoroseomonas wenyumeiae]|uniref:Dephospho-CoA kinase n=3 Tax=Teichococcus wenyumeiae TaxID=2478470 RepID=A0ABX9VQB0_9PROT|nr:dephospho-CoA kinase [Pseudoroseomonas wenyumeiae]RMI27181.1 dephospho-CoA kinase [Pseudoroseomonas wenyumeiae]
MKIWGLTGGIGMGKSTATGVIRRRNIPVFDADATVHALQGRGGRAVAPIGLAFPGAIRDGAVDREALRRAVLGNPAALRRLERIVHPLVRAEERRFLAAARRRGRPLAVLDIPLLFETRGERRCDAVVVVTAPAPEQRKRVLARPGMTPERLNAILKRQTPDPLRRARADHLVRSGLSRHNTRRQILALLERYA